jgi:FkbM family methyltransferase
MSNFYSQNGEDRLLATIFSSSPAISSVCIEVGAFNGVDFSNSLYFENVGWRCILVEPNPDLCTLIRKKRNALLYECAASDRPGAKNLRIIDGAEDYSTVDGESTSWVRLARGREFREVVVAARTLDDILTDSGASTLEFASIDVEGHELEVLKGFTLARWHPRVVLVEDSSELLNRGVLDLMHDQGYRRFYRSGSNDWYAAPEANGLRHLATLVTKQEYGLKGLAKAWLPFGLARAVVRLKRRLKSNQEPRLESNFGGGE